MASTPGVEFTGLEEFHRHLANLPTLLTARLRDHARKTALSIKARARELVPVDTGATKESIGVKPDLPNKQYIVSVFKTPGHLRRLRTADFGRLPFWLEYGTVKMAARPFMRPAGDEHEQAYIDGIEAVVASVLD